MLLALAMAISLQAGNVQADCDGNTIEINACLSARLERAQRRLDDYHQAAVDRYSTGEENQDAVRLGIQASQSAFEAYRAIECSTVYEEWKEGTIRDAMNIQCLIRLTDERAHAIWRNWLRYPDSTPPIRPEPAQTN